MRLGVTRWAAAPGLLLVLLCGGLGGWALARGDGEPDAPAYVEFDATLDTVEPVDAGGDWVCLNPLDPILLDRFGQVCGRAYITTGLEIEPFQRVHVGWFSVVTRDDSESVEALVLSPLPG